MLEEFQEEQRKKMIRTRSIMDWVMGIIFFLAGCYFIISRYMEIKIMEREPDTAYILIGGLFILYGCWRMYRGYKKNYYK